MTDTLGGTYQTGTISIAANGTSFMGVGTLWTQVAEEGDWILANGNVAILNATITDTNVNSILPWTGGLLTNANYILIKMSWLRYDPAILQQKVRELIAALTAQGSFLFVTGSVPDPGLGKEGQWALKVNSGTWQLWYRTGGVWVSYGTPSFTPLGPFDPAVTYPINVVLSWQGKLWMSLQAGNLNHQPDTSPTWWLQVLAGGDQYDVQMFDTDRPASGELTNKIFPAGVTFYVGLTTSYGSAEIASTGTVFYSFKKNGVEFGRLTFSAGNVVGVFTCPVQTSFAFGDALTILAPAVRDATLSGVGGNLVGYR